MIRVLTRLESGGKPGKNKVVKESGGTVLPLQERQGTDYHEIQKYDFHLKNNTIIISCSL